MCRSIFNFIEKRQKTVNTVFVCREIRKVSDYIQGTHSLNCLILLQHGPVVQSVISLTSSLRVILLTVLADSIHSILIFFAEKCEYASHFFSKKFQHICVSLDVNFNESLTNDVISFEQLGPDD